jgi:hypothetical protein
MYSHFTSQSVSCLTSAPYKSFFITRDPTVYEDGDTYVDELLEDVVLLVVVVEE